MKKMWSKILVVLVVASLMLAGCASFCKYATTDKLTRVSSTLHNLQGNYSALVTKLGTNPSPVVTVTVVAVDIALASLGTMQATWCVDEKALANAELAAKAAETVAKQ